MEITPDNYEAFLLDHSEGNLSVEGIAALKNFVAQHPELSISLDDFTFQTLWEDTVPVEFKASLKKDENDVLAQDILNYIEGNLSFEKRVDFEKRVQEDQDLLKELALYKNTILPIDYSFTLDNKNQLLKKEIDFVLNNRVIAYSENQLTGSEKTAFELELKTDSVLQKELSLILKTKAYHDDFIVYPDKAELKKETKVIVLFSFSSVSIAAAILFLIGFLVVFNKFYFKNDIEQLSEKVYKTNKKIKTDSDKLNASDIQEIIKSENSKTLANKSLHERKKSSFRKRTSSIIPSTTIQMIEVEKEQQKEELLLVNEIQKSENNSSALNTEVQSFQNEPEIVSAQTNNDTSLDSSRSYAIGFSHQTFLITEENTGTEIPSQTPSNKGFWQRAVQIAKRANKLGVKSIDGEEKSNHSYFLSFNSFSVEKK